MADKTAQNAEHLAEDFRDPLGVKDPLSLSFEEDEQFEIDLGPNNVATLEIQGNATYEKNCTELSKVVLSDFDVEDEPQDLFVVVDNPEKHTTAMESYITFRVTTKTTRSEFDGLDFQVRRRYNDFLWLRQRLEELQPTLLVPPLPEKHSLKRLDRFSQEFVKTRMGALQVFMQRIAEHPVLSFNKSFQTFLTAKQSELQAAKKEGTGFISRMADSFHNLSASYMMKNRPAEFTVMSEYVHSFGEKLSVLDRVSQRVIREQQDHLNELNEWGPIFTLWSNAEDKLSPVLAAMAKSVEQCFLALQELVESQENNFSQPLKEYILYTEAIKAVLRRRDAIQIEYEMTLEEMNRKKEERDQQLVEEVDISEQSYSIGSLLGRKAGDARQHKVDKLNHLLCELNQQTEQLNDKSTCASADLRADMERWHKKKRRDLRKLFTGMADKQVKYYQKSLDAWEEAVVMMKQADRASGSDVVQDDASPIE